MVTGSSRTFGDVSDLSRRRLLAGAGGAAAAGVAALAAGCSSRRSGRAGSAASSASDTPAVIKRGGTVATFTTAAPAARFETTGVGAEAIAGQRLFTLIYNGVVRLKIGEGTKFIDPTVEGSLATKWEQPDPQTLTFHLRPGVSFHDKPPINGRELKADDVKFSLDRALASLSVYLSRFTSISGAETPNARTVVLKLKAPDAGLLHQLAVGYAWVIAKEAGKPDAKGAAGLDFHDPSTAIGTGPYMLESDEQGVQSSLVKNPRYFETGPPYLDKVVYRWIPDAAAQIASLQTGQSTLGNLPAGSDADFRARNSGRGYGTDYDTRVCCALALAWNQAEVKKIWGYADAPESYGPLTAIAGDAYLPLDKLGDNGKWWKPDLAEAKQLLAAAGYPQGFEVDYNDSSCCEPFFLAEQLAANLAGVGVKLNIKVKQHAAFLATTARGQYDGMAGDQAQIFDPGDWFSTELLPAAIKNLSHVNDPTATGLIAKQQTELDPQKRLDIIHELVRYLSGQVYHLVMPQSLLTQTWQPFVRGYTPRLGFQPSLAVTWLDR